MCVLCDNKNVESHTKYPAKVIDPITNRPTGQVVYLKESTIQKMIALLKEPA